MRWPSVISRIVCAAGSRWCSLGRATSACCLDERLELQQLLAQRGFYKGEPDGNLGNDTRKALRSYQVSIGSPADGFASSGVLDRLRGGGSTGNTNSGFNLFGR